jgi:hypothetical protein
MDIGAHELSVLNKAYRSGDSVLYRQIAGLYDISSVDFSKPRIVGSVLPRYGALSSTLSIFAAERDT